MYRRFMNIIRTHYDILIYIVFGVLTTAVNYAVYFPLYNMTELSATLCNCIAWFISVCFAFFTNKPFVFKSKDWSANTVFPEFIKFTGCRVLSGAMETVTVLITIDILNWNGNMWKLITGILVVIVNYFASKLFVFRRSRD